MASRIDVLVDSARRWTPYTTNPELGLRIAGAERTVLWRGLPVAGANRGDVPWLGWPDGLDDPWPVGAVRAVNAFLAAVDSDARLRFSRSGGLVVEAVQRPEGGLPATVRLLPGQMIYTAPRVATGLPHDPEPEDDR